MPTMDKLSTIFQKNVTIKGILMGFGIGSIGLYGYTSWTRLKKYSEHLKKQPFMQRSIELLRANKPAMDILGGEPLKTQRLSPNAINSYLAAMESKLELETPIDCWGNNRKGNKGVLYVFSKRSSLEDEFSVEQLDFETLKTKVRWTFYKKTDPSKSEYLKNLNFQEAIEAMKKYDPALECLEGLPVVIDNVDVFDQDAVDELNAQVIITCCGKGGEGKKGILYVYASRPTAKDKYTIDSLDFKNLDTDVKWTFYKRTGLNSETVPETAVANLT